MHAWYSCPPLVRRLIPGQTNVETWRMFFEIDTAISHNAFVAQPPCNTPMIFGEAVDQQNLSKKYKRRATVVIDPDHQSTAGSYLSKTHNTFKIRGSLWAPHNPPTIHLWPPVVCTAE